MRDIHAEGFTNSTEAAVFLDCLGETEEIEITKAKDGIAIELGALLLVKCTQPVVKALLLAGIGIPSEGGEKNGRVGSNRTHLPRFLRRFLRQMTGLHALSIS